MPTRRDFLAESAGLLGAAALTRSATAEGLSGDADMKAKQFVATHEEKIRPLERAAALAWWNANVSGKDEDFAAKEEAQNRLDAALADRRRFAELKAVKDTGVDEPLLHR